MKRNAERDLQFWFNSGENRKPLMLRGARQVGKSTLVRNFALSLNLDLIEINFEKHRLKTSEETLDLEPILQEIEYLTKKKFKENSLLFLDEIQDSPKMITCLRFFREEASHIPVIAACSLLEFALTEDEISIPVGRIQYYYLGPFTFSEFLEALEKSHLASYLSKYEKIPSFADQELKEYYFKYLYIGGMPEVIQTYINSNGDLHKVRMQQETLLQSFKDDFHKYSTRSELPRVRKVFESIARIAGHKVKYTEIDSDEKSRDLKRAIELLIYARVFIPVFHSNGTATPLSAYEDQSIYKLYFLDVGLLGCLKRFEWSDIKSKSESLGLLAEQFIAQHLNFFQGPYTDPKLFYWLNDKKSHRAEVDFLFHFGSKVMPVEVKAGNVGHLKSLLFFLSLHKSTPLSIHFGLHPFSIHKFSHQIAVGNHSYQVKGILIKIPLYLVDQLMSIVKTNFEILNHHN